MFILAVILLCACVSADQIESEAIIKNDMKVIEHFQYSSIVFGLMKISQNETLNQKCVRELNQIEKGILNQEVWAMKVLDSSGQRVPGFLLGQSFWLGDYKLCDSLNAPITLLISDVFNATMHYGILNETAPFEMDYKVAYIDYNTLWQVDLRFFTFQRTLQIGLCLPVSCSKVDLKQLMESYLKSDLFLEEKLLNLNATLTHIKDFKQDDIFWNNIFVKILGVIVLFLAVMILAALFLRNTIKDKSRPHSEWINLIQGFDIIENVEKIFHISNNTEVEISTISAVRTLTSVFVVFVHTIFFIAPVLENVVEILSLFRRFIMCVVTVTVDVFFVISGFLQAYSFLRDQNQQNFLRTASLWETTKYFGKKVLHRWLRLAPPYYLVVCLNAVLHAYTYSYSVHYPHNREDLLTIRHFWTLLLFQQNSIEGPKLPSNWTWSLACEMQFFVIGTLLLIIYAKRPTLAKYLFALLFVASCYLHIHSGLEYKFLWTYDSFLRTILPLYFATFVRIIGYVIGIFVAWYLVEKPWKISSGMERILGNTVMILFVVLNAPFLDGYFQNYVMASSALLLGRILADFSIGWLLLAALKKRRVFAQPLFDMKIFQPLGRLSYGVYLLNPIVIGSVGFLTKSHVHLDLSIMVPLFFGFWLMILASSLVLSVCVEQPFCNISKILLKSGAKKKDL